MLQVEYLVVTYENDKPEVTLSLRQADILQALAHDEDLCSNGGCVPALQDIGYVLFPAYAVIMANCLQWNNPSHLSSGVWSIHVGGNTR
jgi:hypothetical protein